MSPKQEFLLFALLGCAVMDLDAQDRELIVQMAIEIPDEAIPDNPMNAAKVFLAYCDGQTDQPHDWFVTDSAKEPDLAAPPQIAQNSLRKAS